MSERWMHRPRTVNVFEARRLTRWGSTHVGHFKTEEAAIAKAKKEIEIAGNVGRVENIINDTVYFDIHEPE